jgi:broad specificity phosphatase PhoE
MMYERKQHLHEKHLKVPPGWILGTILRELNMFEHDGTLDDLHDEHDKALAYWRQNHRQYPPERVWDKYYYDFLFKSFESRHELRAWCEAREKQLKDLVYLE